MISKPSLQKLGTAFEGNPLAILIYDLESLRIVEANQSALRQYGYGRNEFLSLSLQDLREETGTTEEEDSDSGARKIESVASHRKRDGTLIQVRIRCNAFLCEDLQYQLVIAEDVTARRTAHAELLHMAHHDSLTGLANRTLLRDRMAEAMRLAQRLNRKTAIICIDLDRFKVINDLHGHSAGDECLIHVAALLTGRFRGMDTISRTGGDEFTVVLGELEGVGAAGSIGNMLMHAFKRPLELGSGPLQISGSVGIAIFPNHGIDMDEIWRRADKEMYRAKKAGGNRFKVAE